MKIQETQALIDEKSGLVRVKQMALDDTDRELARIRESVQKVTNDCATTRRENERITAETFDLKKQV